MGRGRCPVGELVGRASRDDDPSTGDAPRAFGSAGATPRTQREGVAGDISAAHVEIAARAARHREDLYGEHETVLLDAARALSPDRFQRAAAYWRCIADSTAADADAFRMYERRSLQVSPTFGGASNPAATPHPNGATPTTAPPGGPAATPTSTSSDAATTTSTSTKAHADNEGHPKAPRRDGGGFRREATPRWSRRAARAYRTPCSAARRASSR